MAPREINKIKALKKLSGRLNVAIVIVTPPEVTLVTILVHFHKLVSQRTG